MDNSETNAVNVALGGGSNNPLNTLWKKCKNYLALKSQNSQIENEAQIIHDLVTDSILHGFENETSLRVLAESRDSNRSYEERINRLRIAVEIEEDYQSSVRVHESLLAQGMTAEEIDKLADEILRGED